MREITDINRSFWIDTMSELIREANEVAAQWNGDEAGTLEELALNAYEISKMAEEIRSNLEFEDEES